MVYVFALLTLLTGLAFVAFDQLTPGLQLAEAFIGGYLIGKGLFGLKRGE